MSKHTPSFRSYYNYRNGHKENLQNNGEHLEVAEIQPDVRILPELLPGEEIIARAQGVYVFQPLSSNNQGLIGELYITNFKLSFQTITFPDYRWKHYHRVQDFWHPWNRGLIDIPLASISGLFRLSKNGRRKPFKVGPLKRILVICKNFRLETFSFLQSSSTESHGVASALMGYVFPSEKERLFVFSQDGNGTDKESPKKDQHVLFSTRSDWISELTRLGMKSDDWRISQANEHFHFCQSLPKCFVIPAAIGDDSQLETLCLQLNSADDRRPCVWCWGSPINGTVLCRMSSDVPDETMTKAVQMAHPKKHVPRVLDVGVFCPTVKDLKRSFDLWRDSLLFETVGALEASDDKWFLDVDTSRWMQNISRCLEVTRMAVLEICQDVSVILKEPGDRDLNCVVSTLTQLCLDPSSRKLSGFQRLIEKEFVALGHRFQERLGLVKTDPEKEAPVFLLFLDCVFQLSVQYPTAFEFTDAYLILLYDSALTGAFRTFSMNSQRDIFGPRKSNSTSFPTVWDLDLTTKLHLINPLYKCYDLLQDLPKFASSLLTSLGSPLNAVLIPITSQPFLTVWKNCYFRFIPPLAGRVEPKLDLFVVGILGELQALCLDLGVMKVSVGKEGVSVDGDRVDGRVAVERVGLRRRSQLVRPFDSHNTTTHSLMTFQK